MGLLLGHNMEIRKPLWADNLGVTGVQVCVGGMPSAGHP